MERATQLAFFQVRAWRFIALAVATLALAACGMIDLERFAPEQERAFAPGWIDALRRGDSDAIRAPLDETLRDEESLGAIDAMPDLFPEGEPTDSKLVGASSNYHDGLVEVTLTYEYTWVDAWLLATVVTRREGEGDPRVIGVHIKPLAEPLEQTNAFSLANKGVGHYVMLGIVGLVPLMMLATLVVVLATPGLKRKWGWAIVVLCGVAGVSFDWASGAWEVSLMSVNVLGSGFSRAGPYAPWVLSTSLPLGALLFLFDRRRRVAPAPLTIPKA